MRKLSNIPEDYGALCKCGGHLVLDKVEKAMAIGSNGSLESFPMYVFECSSCHKTYQTANVEINEITLHDYHPSFHGVDIANGKV